MRSPQDASLSPPPRIAQANPRAAYLAQQHEIDAAMARVAKSGSYILGAEVEAFEREFASYVGVAFATGVANGTDAIELALRACGVTAGDAVFTTSHTAVATVAAMDRVGAVPVLVDVEMSAYTMDPEALERAIGDVQRSPDRIASRARAVVPVHLYGHPANMPAILDIARRAGVHVVEDCAQAHGASLNGRRVGSWGDLAAFSFYPTKNLGALGDGGMVVGNDASLAKKIRALRQYGWEERYVSATRGWNSRLDEIQAAILRVKLGRLDEDNAARRSLARSYDELLPAAVQRPLVADDVEHAYHQYVIRSRSRDSLRRALAADGIQTSVHYPVPVHMQPAYGALIKAIGPMSNTETAAREILSLPMYPQLGVEDVRGVCASIARWSSTEASAR